MTSLPVPLSPLIGRERALREVGALLAASRLVTLTGTGGSGKSRLAIAVALGSAPADEHGAAWVELAPLADPTLLADHIATALGLAAGPERSAEETLVAALRARDLLLVLDNCEHLAAACATLVETLLRASSGLRILATSREALDIPGERVWVVPPLSLPARNGRTSREALGRVEAVQLFVARASEANPGFRMTEENAAAVAAVCRRLDGLPLALELAAARTRVLPVEQLAQRLDDAFRFLTTGGRTALPRQKTLRGAFDWSFDLLSREQQVILHRLSAFAGSFSLDAVEEVCSGGRVDSWDVLDALSALVDRSLVVLELDGEAARYRLLETVRQYGRERLLAAGEEAEIRRRHALHYLALAERLAPELFAGAIDLAPLLEMDRAYDNLRAAGDWAAEGGETDAERAEVALRLCVALHWTWYFRGHFQEGWRRLEGALASNALEPTPRNERLRGQALAAAGFLALTRGVPESAREALTDGVELLRRVQLREAREALEAMEPLVYALAIQAAVTVAADPPAAHAIALEATALAERLPVTVLTAFVAHWRGVAAHVLGRRDEARAAFQRTIGIGRSLQHAAAVAHSAYFLGRLEWEEGNGEAAHRVLAESLTLHAATGNRWGIAHCLEWLGRMAVAEGEPDRAVRILGGADRLREELGSLVSGDDRQELDRTLVRARTGLGEAGFAAAWTAGRALPFGPLLVLAQGGAHFAPPKPEAPPGPAAPQPTDRQRLEVAALGPLRLTYAGVPAPAEAWSSVRTRELLVYLLLHPAGATKEEVGLALWPEASTAQVRNSFHVTLHRLRSALGDPQAIRLAAGRYALDPAAVGEIDAARFEREVRRILAALHPSAGGDVPASPDLREALAAALDLYCGPLFAGETGGEWLDEPRERLRRLHAEALAAAARFDVNPHQH